ncbi:MAG: NAD-dependent epimerase/dehydratase family protein [Betaproteobacteria bacterium]|nr:NAD-dependent epimerase/dehydratase family protein [Betaproteobacteria bacterium]
MSLLAGSHPCHGGKSMLVIGGDGTLGRALVATGNSGAVPVWYTSRRRQTLGQQGFHLDLSEPADQWRLPQQEFSSVVFAAGVTSIQDCEARPEVTRHVNVLQPLALAQRLKDQGAFVVCLSSSTVFDGASAFAKTTDATRPTCEYGRQKLELEHRLLALGSGVAVIRLSKVIAFNNALFLGWKHDLLSGNVIRPYSDMAVAPVSVAFAVAVVRQIARTRTSGLHHVSAAEDHSYADLANYMARSLQAPAELVCPASVGYRPSGFCPRYAALDCSGLGKLGFSPPRASEAVDQFLLDALPI